MEKLLFRVLGFTIRVGLFTAILTGGTLLALTMGETPGLALADLSDAPVQALANVPQTGLVYAVLNGGAHTAGVYRSEDQGHTWQVVSSAPQAALTTLTVDPGNDQTIYAGSAGGPLGTNNVWRSQDGGQTWQNFNLPLPASPARLVPAVTASAVDPNHPELLYVGTDGQGVYRFDVGWLGYELVGGISLATSHVKDLVVTSDSQLYALTNGGLYVTTGKDSWRRLDAVPEAPISLAVAPSNPQILYVGGPSGGAYRSLDGGATWESISAGLGLTPGVSLRVTALAVDRQDAAHVLVATGYGIGSQVAPGGIFESYDGGRRWTQIGRLDSVVNELTFDQRIVHAATSAGLERYGEPNEPTAARSKGTPSLRTLTKPTGIQLLVLALTIGLAGLVLVGRLEWLLRRKRAVASLR